MLPKVAITKATSLDLVMASQCLWSTKTNDKALAHIQLLTLDAIRPLTELLEKLNLEETDIMAEEVGYVVKSTITLLGNAASQISRLRRQKVLEEYNRDLLSFAKEREATFIKAAPLLFKAQFPKVTVDLEQVAAHKRAKISTSHSSDFHQASSCQWSSHRPYAPRQRAKPYSQPKTTHVTNARKATQPAK